MHGKKKLKRGAIPNTSLSVELNVNVDLDVVSNIGCDVSNINFQDHSYCKISGNSQFSYKSRSQCSVRAENICLKRRIRYLEEKNKRLLSRLHRLKKKKSGEELVRKCPSVLRLCVENSISQQTKGKTYTIPLKLTALGIYFLSPLTYRFLQTSFSWPSVRTLRRLVSNWPKAPGNLSSTIKALELRTANWSELEKFVSICVDEMSLTPNLIYDRGSDKIIGLEDYGSGFRSSKIATSVMVILVQGITTNWSQPLSYFFVQGQIKATSLLKEITEAVRQLKSINLTPCLFISDQGKNFCSFYTLLGLTIDRPFFRILDQPIYFLFDTSHLIKSTRNCIQNYKNAINFKNFKIDWNDIVHFYNIDSTMSVRCCPKLTRSHIYPNNREKMRVKYATQVLSNTVAAGLNTLYSSGKIDPGKAITMSNTSEFVLFFNNLFDLFNSSNRNERPVFGTFRGSISQMEFLDEASTIVSSIKVFDRSGKHITNKFSFLKGWLSNINSLKLLFNYLSMLGVDRLATRRLNQDKIEQFFGEIRKGRVNSNSVTPQLFSCEFQKRWGLHFLQVINRGNCEDPLKAFSETNLHHSQMVESVSSLECVQSLSSTLLEDEMKSETSTLPFIEVNFNINESNFLRVNAFDYFCGWLYLKSYNNHNCQISLPYFGDSLLDEAFRFSLEKQFDNCHLVKPPVAFINFVDRLEVRFRDLFNQKCQAIGLRTSIFRELEHIEMYQCCDNFNFPFFLNLYIRSRIYYILKFYNRDLKDPHLNLKILEISNL